MARTSAPSHPETLDEAALGNWGEALGRSLVPPELIAIDGDLGAGKTTLIQAICRGLGVESSVTSPTFALVHEYRSPRGPVYHLDLYRLTHESDLTNIGWDDVVGANAVVLVEWPERAGRRMPEADLRIRLAHVPGDERVRALTVVRQT